MEYQVTFDAAGHRYVITVDGVEAGFTHFEDCGEVWDFSHTVVHEQFQGKGLSKPLIKGALDDVRSRGKSIMASCSAVERFVSKNPEYADLLA